MKKILLCLIIGLLLIFTGCSKGIQIHTTRVVTTKITPNATYTPSITPNITQKPKVTPTVIPEPTYDGELLSDKDIEYFTYLLNLRENHCLMACNYDSVFDITFHNILYGLPFNNNISEEEVNILLQEGFNINLDFIKLTSSQINYFLKSKLGYSMSELNVDKMLLNHGWVYIDKYDSYYSTYTGAIYLGEISIRNGYKLNNGYVVLIYETSLEIGTVTLNETEDTFLFVSHKSSFKKR